jgi:hypothetical protein
MNLNTISLPWWARPTNCVSVDGLAIYMVYMKEEKSIVDVIDVTFTSFLTHNLGHTSIN